MKCTRILWPNQCSNEQKGIKDGRDWGWTTARNIERNEVFRALRASIRNWTTEGWARRILGIHMLARWRLLERDRYGVILMQRYSISRAKEYIFPLTIGSIYMRRNYKFQWIFLDTLYNPIEYCVNSCEFVIYYSHGQTRSLFN